MNQVDVGNSRDVVNTLIANARRTLNEEAYSNIAIAAAIVYLADVLRGQAQINIDSM